MIRILGIIEVIGVVITVILAGVWALNPDGPYEAWIFLVVLFSTSIIEHYRKHIKNITNRWATVVKGVKIVIDKIRGEGYKPDIVVLYGRGGSVFGGLIAGNLGNLEVIALDRHIEQVGQEIKSEIIEPNALEAVSGRSVLLVDAEVITGTGLRQAIDAIKEHNPLDVRSAAYHVCTTTNINPEYVAFSSTTPVDVPWRFSTEYKRRSKPWLKK
jgi:hypoxanthine phosphoribosyltransferase